VGRKRPCAICRRWFEPDARTAKWQRACGAADCQQARHAKACAVWREANPDYDRDRRLRERIVADPEPAAALEADPRDGLRWDAVRDALPLEGTVVARELAGLLVRWARDGMRPKPAGEGQQSDRLRPRRPRDATARGDPGP
jgi:hypothetical protein